MDGRIIILGERFERIEQQEFKEIDFVVMGVAFEIQNDMGRLFSESVYRNEMQNRLRNKFSSVECEVGLAVEYGSFTKTYKADLVIDSRAIIELKAIDRTVDEHRLQLLQYLFLSNQKHGKLINFCSPKVTGEYVSTSLDVEERKRLSFDFANFDAIDRTAMSFKHLMIKLLESWGGFLNLELYYQATEHLLGGVDNIVQPISVVSNHRKIGIQKAHLLAETSAYKITALTRDLDNFRDELRRFLRHTSLESIQWVNLNKHIITFETVTLN